MLSSNFKRSQARDSDSFWNRKGDGSSKKKNERKQFPVAKFLGNNNDKKAEGVVQMLGPGGGVGIGCGAGIGFGLVGGIGYGGWPWNHLQPVFGVGIGCGVGVGFGFGQGFGLGLSLDSLNSYISNHVHNNSSSDSNKRSILY